jgi:predicted nucleic acid-binding protein
MVLIDTSCWSQALRRKGDPAIRERVQQLMLNQEACWCDVVRLELWHGIRDAHDVQTLNDLERDLPSLAITGAVWDTACDIAGSARRRGLNVPATDLVIFACARVHDVELEHRDRHFDLLTDLAAKGQVVRRDRL